jgi:hypothetical protein
VPVGIADQGCRVGAVNQHQDAGPLVQPDTLGLQPFSRVIGM